MLPISRLTAADAEKYVEIRREMLADCAWSFGANGPDDKGLNLEHMRKCLARDDYALLVAWDSNRLVAVAGVRRDELFKRRHIANVFSVYTSPSARGQGVGRAVLAAALELASSWPGIEVFQLSVSQHAPGAQRLYQVAGFQPWGAEPAAWKVHGDNDTHIHMYRLR